MSSKGVGSSISEVEVLGISEFGIWLFVSEKEFFLPYDKYPWFKNATVRQIVEIEFSGGKHLHWPYLDVDLSTDILEAPERFPLVAK